MRATCAALAVVMLLASIGTGFVAVPSPEAHGAPVITFNICRPLQGLDRAPELGPLARPALPSLEIASLQARGAVEFAPARLNEFIGSLDPPPPKSLG